MAVITCNSHGKENEILCCKICGRKLCKGEKVIKDVLGNYFCLPICSGNDTLYEMVKLGNENES